MGSTLTGSTVASTYTGLLKTSDTGAVNSTLKTISDGSGNDSALQLSTTSVNIAAASGNFTIATDKLTVAGASGNTAVAGTLSATGNFAINTNKFTVAASSGNTACAGTLTSTGALNVASSASIVGNVTTNGFVILNGAYGIQQNSAGGTNNFAGPCNFTNLATFSGGIAFNSNVTLANNLTVNGTTTLNSVAALNGNITLGDSSTDTLTVAATPTFSAPATFSGAATFNGNVTIGSDATDTLAINAAFNPATETIAAGDFVLIQDVSDSNKIKKVASSSVGTTVNKRESGLYDIPNPGNQVTPYAHTLGSKPTIVQAFLVCQTSDANYASGQEVNLSQLLSEIHAFGAIAYVPAFSVYCDDTYIYAVRTKATGNTGTNTCSITGAYPGYDNAVNFFNTEDPLIPDISKWKIKFKAISL
jgi:hypothetical protein